MKVRLDRFGGWIRSCQVCKNDKIVQTIRRGEDPLMEKGEAVLHPREIEIEEKASSE